MAKWFLEPGHTAAEFSVRHMMVTYVRGHLKNVHGTLDFDARDPRTATVDVTIRVAELCSGEPARDAHLRSSDFLDAEKFPEIRFRGHVVRTVSASEFEVGGDVTIRGVTRPATLQVRYLGEWQTPWWEDGVDKGPKTRAGFLATTTLNRQDFGVSWNSVLDRGGVVVGNDVEITIDAEAIREDGPTP